MKRQSGSCHCLIAFTLLTSVVSLTLIVLIIARPNLLLSIGNTSVKKGDGDQYISSSEVVKDWYATKDRQENKLLYVFAYSVPWEDYQYITEDGVLQGLSIDLIDAVCKEANRKCSHVVSPSKYCWNNDENIGIGLLAKWYDGCVGHLRTNHRAQMFEFSGNFYHPKKGQLYQRNADQVDTSNLQAVKIGTKSKWYIGEECLMNIGADIGNIITVADEIQMKALIENRTVDLILTEEKYFDEDRELKSISGTYDCVQGGYGVMHRVDSDIPYWFNPAFNTLKRRGVLKSLCRKYPQIAESCIVD